MRGRLMRMISSTRFRRRLAVAALGMAGLAALMVLVAWRLMNAPPAWWVAGAALDPERESGAREVENAIVNEAHRIRGSDAWTIEVSSREATAWLNVRLPMWLANREVAWPREVEELQLAFESGAVLIGARVRGNGQERFIAAAIEPSIRGGALWAPARRVSVGRLGVPASWLLPRERPGSLPGSLARVRGADGIARALGGEQPVLAPAVVELEDGRRVRLVGINARDGRVVLTCATEE